jgi:hypothetical protein
MSQKTVPEQQAKQKRNAKDKKRPYQTTRIPANTPVNAFVGNLGQIRPPKKAVEKFNDRHLKLIDKKSYITGVDSRQFIGSLELRTDIRMR